jgi:hypothetical protein
MNASLSLGRLRSLGIAALTTSEAAGVLGASVTGANKTLYRLADAGHIRRVTRGQRHRSIPCSSSITWRPLIPPISRFRPRCIAMA